MENITTVGRRKEAVARVRLSTGQGQILVNGKPITEYFPGPVLQKRYNQPLDITTSVGKYTISVKVAGGGQASQLDAVIHGITRAIAKTSPASRTALKREGLLTR
ncbi:MAG: 30S ribosomal protein S9, partial [Candidatus Daviesbacteria bacterium]|nr:30S ribosomal protein S9 [Candidatus Daviesbacteria bacterium]